MNTSRDKSVFWKAGMVFVSFLLARILATIVVGGLAVAFFASQSSGISGLAKIEGTYLWYISMLIILVAELVGIRYGVRYVVQKAVIAKNDILKIIMWFVIANIILQLVGSNSMFALTFSVIFLLIECFAIQFFFHKAINTVSV